MAPFFKHPVFDLAREKVKRVIRQLEKPQEALENSWEQQCIFHRKTV